MPSCRVNECSNRSGGGVRLFSIPKRSRDVDIAKKWLKSVWDKELDDEQFALLMKEEFRVCAEHFVESDFDARGKLKADAVPSRFPWNGGPQRASAMSKARSIPAEHKSNGSLVNKLTRALKTAESIVDGEIKDIDKWIVQLEAQVEHLRSKREKLIQHKAELGRSLDNSSAKSSEFCSPRGQSSMNFLMNNGTNYNYFNTNNSDAGESLILSNAALLAGGEMPDQSQQRRIKQPKIVPRTAEDTMLSNRYSDNNNDARLFMPPVPTPPESGTEAIALTTSNNNNNASSFSEQSVYPAATNSASAHLANHRQFATRRKNFKPTRRIDLASRALALIAASAGDEDEKTSSQPSSSIVTEFASQPTVSLKEEKEDNKGMECEEPSSSWQQCDLTPFSQTQ